MTQIRFLREYNSLISVASDHTWKFPSTQKYRRQSDTRHPAGCTRCGYWDFENWSAPPRYLLSRAVEPTVNQVHTKKPMAIYCSKLLIHCSIIIFHQSNFYLSKNSFHHSNFHLDKEFSSSSSLANIISHAKTRCYPYNGRIITTSLVKN